jgi:hypothetical protein
VGGREVCWCQIQSPGRRRAWGEWPGRTKEKSSMPTNAPALKKGPGVGGPDRWAAPSYHAHFPVLDL